MTISFHKMPVTLDALLSVLNVAGGSERGDIQRQAEEQLAAWETEPGFHLLLQDVYLDMSLPLQERWLAIICFKNGVEKYWRSSRTNAIGKEEKHRIRMRLFLMLDDKNNQLTIQNAHAIARVVRFDFPAEWPSLFDDISRILESCIFVKTDLVAANNVLVILNQVIKTISMVRVGRARHAFQSKAGLILPVLIKLYSKFFLMWTASADLTIMEICYTCLKNLRRIIPEGFEQPHKNTDITEFFKMSIGHLQTLVMEHERYSSDLLEKYVKSYSKLYVNLINSNPTSFVLLPCSQEIISTYMSLLESKAEEIYNSSNDNDFWEVLALKGLLILKKMVTYIYKQGAVTLKQRNDKAEVTQAISLLKSQLFTPEVIFRLCDLLIDWYLRLKPADLESWLLEPEEWTNEELSSSWEYQVRPCAENFYEDLIKYFKDDLSDFIMNKISTGLSDDASVDNILQKDSTLCTFQLSGDLISDRVNFNQLLTQVFIPEGLRNDVIEQKIIKRRICLIISTWVGINCSRESRVEIYKLLLNFLQPDNNINDKVVKLITIQTLRSVINDWDFNKHDFQPFLKDYVSLLILSMADFSLTESKLYVLDTLGTLVDRCNPLIDSASLENVLRTLPQYWEQASKGESDESILKTSLLRVLKNLIVALNDRSTETQFITLPLIRSCCSHTSGSDYLLSEDGFELWLAVLQYYPANTGVNSELVEFFDFLPVALELSTEILVQVLSIVRSYSLLCPELFETASAVKVFRLLSTYIASMRDDAFEVAVSLLEIVMLEKASEKRFLSGFLESGLMTSILGYILDENHSIVLANKLLGVLSRLATSLPEVFFSILDHLGVDSQRLVDVWISYYKNIGSPRHKKISLLALLSIGFFGTEKGLLDLSSKLGELLRKGFLFLEEVQETSLGSCQAYEGDYAYNDIDDYAYLDPDIAPHGEKIRYLRLLESKDPVSSVNLKQFLFENLSNLRRFIGEEAFLQVMALCDQYTREKVQEVLSTFT